MTCKELKAEIEKLRRENAELKQRLADAHAMSDLLEREQQHKADVVKHQIASMLQLDYVDFQSVIDEPMNIDLGENMRVQLKNVFTLLQRKGVPIGEK